MIRYIFIRNNKKLALDSSRWFLSYVIRCRRAVFTGFPAHRTIYQSVSDGINGAELVSEMTEYGFIDEKNDTARRVRNG